MQTLSQPSVPKATCMPVVQELKKSACMEDLVPDISFRAILGAVRLV